MRKELNYFVSGCADDVEKLAHALLRAVDTAKLAIIDEGDSNGDVRIKAEAGHIFLEYKFSDKKWTPDEETVTPSVEEKLSLTPNDVEKMFKELDNNDDEDEYI